MLKAGFGLTPDDPLYAELNPRFLALYREAIAVETVLFPGMAEVLDYLEAGSIRWGVVTNKPGWLTEPLLKALDLWPRMACVVSGDTLSARKPDPEPLLYACARIGALPGRSLYVGDAERDILAGKQAGMTALVAGFGYLGAEDRRNTGTPTASCGSRAICSPGWADQPPRNPKPLGRRGSAGHRLHVLGQPPRTAERQQGRHQQGQQRRASPSRRQTDAGGRSAARPTVR